MSTPDDLRKLRENALGMPAYQLQDLLDYTIRIIEAAEALHGFPDKSASHDALRDALDAEIPGLS